MRGVIGYKGYKGTVTGCIPLIVDESAEPKP